MSGCRSYFGQVSRVHGERDGKKKARCIRGMAACPYGHRRWCCSSVYARRHLNVPRALVGPYDHVLVHVHARRHEQDAPLLRSGDTKRRHRPVLTCHQRPCRVGEHDQRTRHEGVDKPRTATMARTKAPRSRWHQVKQLKTLRMVVSPS